FSSVENGTMALAEQLAPKQCLLVIDDVWDPAHLRPFLHGGDQCARLITTRDFSIVARFKPIAEREMTSDEAIDMLTPGLHPPPAGLQLFAALAQRMGYWPLQLELAAGQLYTRLQRGATLPEALDSLNQALDEEGVAAFGDQVISKTLDASLKLLSSEQTR